MEMRNLFTALILSNNRAFVLKITAIYLHGINKKVILIIYLRIIAIYYLIHFLELNTLGDQRKEKIFKKDD